jgi:ribosomal protein L31E
MFETFAQIEVGLAVLWEGVEDDPTQAQIRRRTVAIADSILLQIQLWERAEKAMREVQEFAARYLADDIDMN